MINIMCLITITVMVRMDDKTSIPWMVQTQAHGHVINSTEEYYNVDFSKEAKEKKWVGDYSERMVQRSLCMPIQGPKRENFTMVALGSGARQ